MLTNLICYPSLRRTLLFGSLLAIFCCGSLYNVAEGQQPAYRTYGNAQYQGLGTSVSGGFDINGDGINDVLASAEAGVTTLPGFAKIYSATGTVLRSFSTGSSTDSFGSSVKFISDINGDGIADVLVGAQANSGCAPAQVGFVRAYSGATGAVLYTVMGGAGDHFGSLVDVVGDLTGDGKPEFLVSAPWTTRQTSSPCSLTVGAIQIRNGATGALIRTHTGTTFGQGFGSGAGAIGDVNNDGFGDYAASGVLFFSGTTRVFSGATGAQLFNIPLAGGKTAIAKFTDVNGDGHADWLLGIIEDGANQNGIVHVISGANGATLYSVSGNANDYLGSAVATIGDITGDGIPDFVSTGHPPVQLASPLPGGFARVFSGANGAVLANIYGKSGAADYFGYSVAAITDVNGDLKPDFVVGATGDRQFFSQEGSINVIYSASGSPTTINECNYFRLASGVTACF